MSDYNHLNQKFDTLEQVAKDISKFKQLDAPQLEENVDTWRNLLRNKTFPVTFFGPFSAGKSTIINAVLGLNLLPTSVTPTTAFPTIIRAGSKDNVKLTFVTKDAWMQIANALIVEILDALQIPETERTGLYAFSEAQNSQNRLILMLNHAIDKNRNATEVNRARSRLGFLTELLRFNDFGKSESISLTKFKTYVEDNKEALTVAQADVSLANYPLANDIILVDLPGLGSFNKKHQEITETYIREKAKAIVVCLNEAVEGRELDYLRNINKENTTLLDRAFWLVSKWDTFNDQQQREIEAHLANRNDDFQFRMGKLFKVSALTHLLLEYVRRSEYMEEISLHGYDKCLIQIGVSPADPRQADLAIKNVPYVSEFADFKNNLLHYLNAEARQAFEKDAHAEITRLRDMLLEQIPSNGDISFGDDLTEDDWLQIDTDKMIRQLEDDFPKTINDIVQKYRVHLKNTSFWGQKQQQHLKSLIEKDFSLKQPGLETPDAEYLTVFGDAEKLRLVNILGEHLLHKLPYQIEDILFDILQSNLRQNLHAYLQVELARFNEAYPLPSELLNDFQHHLDFTNLRWFVRGILVDMCYDLVTKNVDAILSNKQTDPSSVVDSLLGQLQIGEDVNRLSAQGLANYSQYLTRHLTQPFTNGLDDNLRIQLQKAIRRQLQNEGGIAERVSAEKDKRQGFTDARTLLQGL